MSKRRRTAVVLAALTGIALVGYLIAVRPSVRPKAVEEDAEPAGRPGDEPDAIAGDAEIAGRPGDEPDAMPVSLTAKAHVWTARYPNGESLCFGSPEQMTEAERESRGHLVVPVNRPIRLALATSNAVDFRIPLFRIAQRVEPNGRAQVGFIATRTGEFEIRNMRERIGSVAVVTAQEFDSWLSGIGGRYGAVGPVSGSLAHRGRQLFVKLQCQTCHNGGPAAKGPNLERVYGTRIPLKDGSFEICDDQYIRTSIRRPKQQVRDGWEAIMPAYDESKVTAEELATLVAYIRSLQPGDLKRK